MSGGGAGKVYFVLYLAVVLELLIIIVERDEAEEHLHAKQKETMKIVQSILSQLQAGSGTEGINTRPQDEITIPPQGINFKEVMGTDIKTSRKYVIEVGVTDVTNDLKRKEGETPAEFEERVKKLIRLANVQELEYQIFFNLNDDPLNPPSFPSESYFVDNKIDVMKLEPGAKIETPDGETWIFKGAKKLIMDNEQTFKKVNIEKIKYDPLDPFYKEPIIVGDEFVPGDIPKDSSFFYSSNRVNKDGAAIASGGDPGSKLKRPFVVYFEPPAEQGWYKLRFYSQTNRILGIAADTKAEELSENATVNIGTVQLKVKDLVKVKKELEIELDKFQLPKQEDLVGGAEGSASFDKRIIDSKKLASNEPDYIQLNTKIELYGYIVRLLTPGKSVYFPQNSNSIEFDVRVLTPKPKTADPVVMVNNYLHTFDAVLPSFNVSISPFQENANKVFGFIYNKGDETGAPVAELTFEPEGVPATQGGVKRFIAKSNKPLLAGNGMPRKYTVKIVHDLMGKQGDSTATLNVYPAIDENEVRKLETNFAIFASFENDFFFNFTPPSGRNIAPDQFGYYFKTDADAQERGLVPGLKAEKSDKLTFPAKAKEASLKIVWVDPVSKEEVEVFPEKTVTIKQAPPSISVAQAQNSIAGDDVLSIRVSNIRVTAPIIGTANLEFGASLKPSDVQVRGYTLIGDPTIVKDGESYSVDFKLRGEPNEDGFAKGNINLTLTAFAVNPTNGVRSEVIRRPYTIMVNKKIESDDNYFD